MAAYRAKHSANLPTDPRRAALISKGANMMETRFHFADGAVEQAMLKIAGTHGPERFGLDLGDLIEQVNNVMFQVLTAHIGLRDAQFRGAVWTGP